MELLFRLKTEQALNAYELQLKGCNVSYYTNDNTIIVQHVNSIIYDITDVYTVFTKLGNPFEICNNDVVALEIKEGD